ncbi:MAG: DciA family protein [Bacillota bacterium]|jgi:ribosomal protein L32
MARPEIVGNVLQRSLDGMGLLPKARRFQVFALWPRIVGDIALNARPRRVDGDVLYVATSSSMWAQELSMMRRRIISEINRALGGDYLKDIRFSEHLWGITGNYSGSETDNFPDKEYREFISQPDSISRPDLSRIKLLIGGEHDSTLSFTFQKFAVTMEKRKKYLVRKGYQKCPTCGYIYQPGRKCPSCRAKEEFYNHRKIISILEKHPETSDTTLSVSTGITQRHVFERAREELDSRWYRTVISGVFKAGSGQLSGSEKAQLQGLIKKLASLRSGKPEHELTQQDLNKVLGKRFSGLLKHQRWRKK